MQNEAVDLFARRRSDIAESQAHKRAKHQVAGKSGVIEAPLREGQRLDAQTEKRAVEVERSGEMAKLKAAARRLEKSGKPQKVLQVPQHDMSAALEAMRKVGVHGSVRNMGSTKRRSV